MKGKRETAGPGQDEKARRLAEALRRNLKRRKAQARARAAQEKAAGDEAADKGDS